MDQNTIKNFSHSNYSIEYAISNKTQVDILGDHNPFFLQGNFF